MTNTRYPHSVIVKRYSGGSAVADPTETVICLSVCRNYLNGVPSEKKGVIVSDYILALPVADVEILVNDTVYVTERSRSIAGKVVAFQRNNFGMNIWYDLVNE